MSGNDYSTESQLHTRICILESQLDVKERAIGTLKEKIKELQKALYQLAQPKEKK
tara:strand:+ start:557 stop:721 length:165 start_codon:yes stop_codon:yes gene_type:complete